MLMKLSVNEITAVMIKRFCIFILTAAVFFASNAFAQPAVTKSISNWYPVDTLPAPTRAGAMSCQFADYGVILGGSNWVRGSLEAVLNDFWKFDPSTSKWTSLPPFPGGK